MFVVTFTNNGAPVCHWHGFATYGDARRAIADADMAIPMHWDWRIDAAPGWPVTAHTGQPARVRGCWLDETGRLFLDTDLGFGLVHTLDTGIAAQAVEAGAWTPAETPFVAMPARFGYILRPQEKAAPGAASQSGP